MTQLEEGTIVYYNIEFRKILQGPEELEAPSELHFNMVPFEPLKENITGMIGKAMTRLMALVGDNYRGYSLEVTIAGLGFLKSGETEVFIEIPEEE